MTVKHAIETNDEKHHYILVEASNTLNLAREVRNMMERGYKPIGGIAVSSHIISLDAEAPWFIQAMIL